MSNNNVDAMDIRPEYLLYRDTGCDVHPACLSCPLPRCKYDGYNPAIEQYATRNAAIRKAHQDGASLSDLVKQFGLAKRTLSRILQGAENAT